MLCHVTNSTTSPHKENQVELTNDDFTWEFDMMGIKVKDKETAKQLKQQILENQEKAQKYDDLMKANSDVIQNNISITKEHKILEELKEKIFHNEYCPNKAEGKVCDVCIFKDELQTIVEKNQ